MGKPVNLLRPSILLTLKGFHPLHRDVIPLQRSYRDRTDRESGRWSVGASCGARDSRGVGREISGTRPEMRAAERVTRSSRSGAESLGGRRLAKHFRLVNIATSNYS